MTIWDEWKAKQEAKRGDKLVDEITQKPDNAPPEWNDKPIGHYEKMLKCLNLVTFLPGSYDKRFARNMYGLCESDPEAKITVKQAALIETMFHRYRRQISPAVHDRLCTVCKGKQ